MISQCDLVGSTLRDRLSQVGRNWPFYVAWEVQFMVNVTGFEINLPKLIFDRCGNSLCFMANREIF